MRLAKNARLVLDVVSEQPPGAHAAVHEIVTRARQRQAGIGVSTVYRALERLTAAGLVQAVRVPGAASALYEPARTGHAHFLCSRCGTVADIDYDIPVDELTRLDAAHGVVIRGATVSFEGFCAACASG